MAQLYKLNVKKSNYSTLDLTEIVLKILTEYTISKDTKILNNSILYESLLVICYRIISNKFPGLDIDNYEEIATEVVSEYLITIKKSCKLPDNFLSYLRIICVCKSKNFISTLYIGKYKINNILNFNDILNCLNENENDISLDLVTNICRYPKQDIIIENNRLIKNLVVYINKYMEILNLDKKYFWIIFVCSLNNDYKLINKLSNYKIKTKLKTLCNYIHNEQIEKLLNYNWTELYE